MIEGKIISLNVSAKKGTAKTAVGKAILKENSGIAGDAHAGSDRQVSLLDWGSVEKWLEKRRASKKSPTTAVKPGAGAETPAPPDTRTGDNSVTIASPVIRPGDFAENITTSGFDFKKTAVGDTLRIINPATGQLSAVIEITCIGKPCHAACNIKKMVGDCVMPKEGVFARVIQGGLIKTGDIIRSIKGESQTK